jgi:phosphohistidine phosphatase
MLHLFLLRHGKATKYQDDISDYARTLNKQGTAQVNQVGYILKENGVRMDHILASSAARTTETAEIVNHYLNCKNIQFEKNLYLADYHSILKSITDNGKGNSLLYVGHNNGISDFASYITGQPILLSTSQLLEITFTFDNWKIISASTGTIKMNLKPDVHSF